MFKNYLKTAVRNLKKNRLYSFLNIFGLAVGIACCILIQLYVRNELSYDRYHENAGRIYRVTTEFDIPAQKSHWAATPAPLAPAMISDFQEIESAVRFCKAYGVADNVVISSGEKHFDEDRWFFADASVFDVFTFPLIRGDKKTALQAPASIVISEAAADKYFGKEDALGKVLTVQDKIKKIDYLVTGVLKNPPKNSHIRFDFLASFATVDKYRYFNLSNWFNIMYYTYVTLKKDCRAEELEIKFPGFFKKHTGISMLKLHLQPLASIHLHSQLSYEIEPNSDIAYVYVLSAVALLILIIACVNFMNMATSQTSSRAREIGIRKVVGADRRQLVGQFLGESLILALLALCLAVLFIEIILPSFNAFTGKDLVFVRSGSLRIILGLIATGLLVGLTSGLYPALFLSAFDPVKVIKGRGNSGAKRTFPRRVLIIFQFLISTMLMISTLIIGNQMKYVRSKKLGFQQEQVVVLPIRQSGPMNSYETLKNEFLKNPRVLKASASSGLPGRISHHWYVVIEGVDTSKARPSMPVLMVDHDFVKTMGLELAEGRDFSKSYLSDEQEAVLLNEAAVDKYGLKYPLGLKVKTENKKGAVVGVLKNFHFASLHQIIEPMIMYIAPRYFSYLSVRISPLDMPSTLAFLRSRWAAVVPDQPFEYFFLDADFMRFYRSEEKLGRLFGYSSSLSILVACLGLFGLATHAAEKRTKEIGIRRILGASVPGLVASLTKEFLNLVLIANIIAWPVAYYAISRWLQNFAYRTRIGLWIFVLSAGVSLAIALLTVSFQAVKAALANPVDSLKYE